uniref:Uncharacterized protein n=1 Tax=Plectus sambesii TaxID=2011161 RepID=A0A914XGR3_9BILA
MEQLVDDLLLLSMQQHLLDALDVDLKKTGPLPRMSEVADSLANLQESFLSNETCIEQMCDRLNTESTLNEPPIDQRKVAKALQLLKAKEECEANDKSLEGHLKRHGVTLEKYIEMADNDGNAEALNSQCERLKMQRDAIERSIAEEGDAGIQMDRWAQRLTEELQQNSVPDYRLTKWKAMIAGLRLMNEVGEEIEDNLDEGTIVVPVVCPKGNHRLFVHLRFEEKNGEFFVKDIRVNSQEGCVDPQLALFASQHANRETDLFALIGSVYRQWSRDFMLMEEIDSLRLTNGIDWIPAKRTLLLMVSGGKRTITLTVDTNYPEPGSLHLTNI